MARTHAPPAEDFVRAGTLAELEAKSMTVVRGRRTPLLVLCREGRCFAVDNRCPHLGFPLDRGSLDDGILTCHWHHARFDVASGGGFDLWADDLATAEVRIRDGEVWVAGEARHADGDDHWRNRLHAGMEHNLGLVIAKAILGLRAQGADARVLVREAALYGVRNRDRWGTGLTVLAALGNLIDGLPDDLAYLALYKGIRNVAADCEDQAARRPRQALAGAPPMATLARWLRQWTAVRHRDGAERTLLTAITAGVSPGALAELVMGAATDRVFADGGHALDFANKAFELLDFIGWEHASEILPAIADVVVTARGAEESDAWRRPLDLVALCADAEAELRAAGVAHAVRPRDDCAVAALAEAMLGEDPHAIAGSVIDAARAGAAPSALGGALAYAAALRVARFGSANEHADWESAHHAFTYANAVHRLLARLEAAERPVPAECLRAVLHGSMRLYLLRFLNVPAARIPGGADDRLDELPYDAAALRAGLLAALDRHAEGDAAARHVARYLALGHDADALIATLVHAVLREDAGFHAYQMVEAGVRQFRCGRSETERATILVALARYLAAHSPTERGELQTARVARKLAHGDPLHEAPAAAGT